MGTTVDFLVCRLFYPALLLCCGVLRTNALSFLYLAAFVHTILFAPHAHSTLRKTQFVVNCVLVAIVAALATAGHVVFISIFSGGDSNGVWLPRDSWEEKLIHYLGWQRYDYYTSSVLSIQILQTIRSIAPDPLMCVGAAVTAALVQLGKVLIKPKDIDWTGLIDSEEMKSLRKVLSFVALTLLGISALSVPSLLGLPYLAGLLCGFMFLMFRRSLPHLVERLRRPLIGYSVLHLFFIYAEQFPYINSHTPTFVQDILGIYYWRDFDSWRFVRDEGWPVLVGFACLFLMFLVLCQLNFMHSYSKACEAQLERRLKKQALNSEGDVHKHRSTLRKSILLHMQQYYRRIMAAVPTHFLSSQSYRIVLAVFFVVGLIEASFLSLPLIVYACVGALLPRTYVIYSAIPAQIYAVFYLITQYLFNIPFGTHLQKNETIQNVGWHSYDAPFPHLLLLSALEFTLAVMWHMRVYYQVTASAAVTDVSSHSSGSTDFEQEFSDKRCRVERPKKRSKLVSGLIIVGQAILQQSYHISLAGLWICCLTRVNLFNAGYMLFFVVFIVFETLAMKAWLLLLLYADAVILILYAWQVSEPWTRDFKKDYDYSTDLIGLEFYSTVWIGLVWHVIILVFSIFQWELLKFHNRSSGAEKHIGTRTDIAARRTDTREYTPLLSDSIETSEGELLQTSKERHHVTVYNVLLAVLAEIKRHFLMITYLALLFIGLLSPASLVDVVYVAFVFMCFVLHMILPWSAHKIVRTLWPGVVFFAAVLLAVRYIYQFPQLSKYIKKHYVSGGLGLTLEDWGLETYDVSNIYIDILPNGVALVCVAVQLKLFGRPEQTIAFKPGGASYYWLQVWEDFAAFIKRLLILHSHHITQLVLIFVAVTHVSAMNGVYLVAAIVSVYLSSRSVIICLPLLLYSEAAVLGQLIYRLSAFDGEGDSDAAWIGFDHHEARWYSLQRFIYVIFALLIQNFAYHWRFTDYPGKQRETAPRGQQPCPLFIIDQHRVGAHDWSFRDFIDNTKWLASNIFSLFGSHFLGIVLVIVAFKRNNIIGIAYFALVSACLVSRHFNRLARTALPFFVGMLSACIVAQYFLLLGFPPKTDISWPWDHLSQDVKYWVSLSLSSSTIIGGDFVALMLAMDLIFVRRMRFPEAGNFDFTMEPRSWNNQIKFLLMRYSDKTVLILIFVLGTYRENVLAFFYAAISLYFLYLGDFLLEKGNKYWRYGILLVCSDLLFQLVYSMPWIPSSTGPTSYGANVGLAQLTDSNTFTKRGVMLLLIILAFMTIQRWIFQQESGISKVYNFVRGQRGYMREREKAKAEVITSYTLSKMNNLKEEYSARIRRLILIRQKQKVGETLLVEPEPKPPKTDDLVNTALDASNNKKEKAENDHRVKPEKNKVRFVDMSSSEDESLSCTSDEEVDDSSDDLFADFKETSYSETIRGYLTVAGEATLSACRTVWKYTHKYILIGLNYIIRFLDYMNDRKYDADIDKLLAQRGSAAEHFGLVHPSRTSSETEQPAAVIEAAIGKSQTTATTDVGTTDQTEQEGAIETPTVPKRKTRMWDDSLDDHEFNDGDLHGPSVINRLTQEEGSGDNGIAYMYAQPEASLEVLAALEAEDSEVISEVVKRDGFLPRLREISRGIPASILANTDLLCYFLMVINHTYYASITSLVFPVSLFLYAALAYPTPARTFWRIMLVYVTLLILAKFMFQFPIFCICYGDTQTYDMAPNCGGQLCNLDQPYPRELGTPYVIGIYKTSGPFLSTALLDFLLLLAMLWHKYMLIARGLWEPTDIEILYNAFSKRLEDWSLWVSHERRQYALAEKQLTKNKGKQKQKAEAEKGDNDETKEKADLELHPSATLRRRKHNSIGPASSVPTTNDSKQEGEGRELVPLRSRRRSYMSTINEDADPLANLKRAFGWVNTSTHSIVLFYRLVVTTILPDKDYYTAIFIVQLLSFFYLAIFQQDFTGIQFQDVYTIFTQSRIPTSYVFLILAQFLLIIIERVIYLFSSLLSKVVFHYLLVIIIHTGLFFYLPQENEVVFNQSWGLWVFYLLQCIYFYLSCLQIRYGYPIFTSPRPLTDSKSPSDIRNYLYTGYRALPFVFEIQTVLDWCIHKTALDLTEWWKFEDIYSSLFVRKCRIALKQRENRHLGEKQPRFDKCLYGVTFFIFLIAIIWFPLLLLSQGGIGTDVNRVQEARISIGLVGWESFYTTYESQNITGLSKSQFTEFRNTFSFVLPDERSLTQTISFDTYPETYWEPTQQALLALLAALSKPNPHVEVFVAYSFTRLVPGNNPVIAGQVKRLLTKTEVDGLLEMLSSNRLGHTSIRLNNMYSRVFRLPLLTTISVPSKNERVSLTAGLIRKIIEQNYTTAHIIFGLSDGRSPCGNM
eukprot:TRINITY_DN5039_c0_g2_i7.p1 TRINITY_DN5039_c0_g2~~TRINITY_DN5039_c0_g2_i7.p1  ORF type:complete len:2374 (+),score=229.13 TRINITY_DN5039_c0_g2_i7:70-7191(+)